jgi:hypothetical protein
VSAIFSVPFRADRVYFVNEYDTWRVIFCGAEQLSNEFGTVTKVFLDQLGTHDTQEGGRRLVCNCFGKKRLPCTRYTIEDNAFRRLDPHFFI